MLIKTAFSRSLPNNENINQSRKSKRERGASGNAVIGSI